MIHLDKAKGDLGITLGNRDDGGEGVVVVELAPMGLATWSGLSKGDVILRVNSHPVGSHVDAIALIDDPASDAVELFVAAGRYEEVDTVPLGTPSLVMAAIFIFLVGGLAAALTLTRPPTGDSRAAVRAGAALRPGAGAPWRSPSGWLDRGDVRATVDTTGHATDGAALLRVELEWRRRDEQPRQKAVIVTDCKNMPIEAVPVNLTAERSTILFRSTGCAPHHVYYLPYRQQGVGGEFRLSWLAPPADLTDSQQRMVQQRASAIEVSQPLIAFEARTPQDDVRPMGVPASEAEVRALLERFPRKRLFVFPEPRTHAVRMRYRLPQRWALSGPSNAFKGDVVRGEFFTFQIGLYVPPTATAAQRVRSARLAGALAEGTVFNLRGVDARGQRFERDAAISPGQVLALWVGAPIPAK